MGEGVHVFDAATGARLTTDVIPTNGWPSDLALVCNGLRDCSDSAAIPATSTWGLAVLTLLLLTAGTLASISRRPAENQSISV